MMFRKSGTTISKHRQPDGFASLSADMMERRLGAPSGTFFHDAEPGTHPEIPGTKPREPYTGPERRTRDISPVTERRKDRPPRVKVSVRLEPHRYENMRNAGILTARTHQDLMTSALDEYLARLGLSPKGRMTAKS